MKLPDYTMQALEYTSDTLISKTTINMVKSASLVFLGIVIGLTI